MNPFTFDLTELPMLVGQSPSGRVLLSRSPLVRQFYKPMVVYQSSSDDFEVCFIRIGDNQWRRIVWRIPLEIITTIGLFYVINGPDLFYFDVDKNRLSQRPELHKYPGVFPNWVSPNLKLLVNSSDKLFVVCTLSYQREDFGFMRMDFFGQPVNAYVNHLGQYCYPRLIKGNRPHPVANVILDFHPYGVFSWMSRFWSDGEHRWGPVGWIMPNLNMHV